MNLADKIRAARGTMYDICNIASLVGARIAQAQRFDLADDLMRACYNLLDTKPSTMNAALPMCRLPYPLMWLEYRGGLGPENRRGDIAPIPERQGFLIEHFIDYPNASQTGQAMVAWVHGENARSGHSEAINVCPFAIYFDWRPDGDVNEIVQRSHQIMIEQFAARAQNSEHDRMRHIAITSLVASLKDRYFRPTDDAEMRRFFMNRHGWQKFANDQREIEALRAGERHLSFGLSPYGLNMLLTVMLTTYESGDTAGARTLIGNWLTDIQGEGMILECLMCMLNSRNVVQHEAVDLSKLNKARRKRGKIPLLDYTKTSIALTRSMHRVADARGIEREAARQHLVRGHFKIRRTGVFWWSPFVRGDARRGEVRREEYSVT
jgi:hypothetical protein